MVRPFAHIPEGCAADCCTPYQHSLLLSSNQQEGNDPLDIGLNARKTIERSKGGRGVKSELSVSAYAKRIGKTHQFVSQTIKGGDVYEKLASQLAGFEADYRQACADKLISPTHLNEMDAPDSVLPVLYGLIKQQKWNVKETRAASDRIRSVAECVPAWLPDVSSVYPKVAMEPGYAKSTAAALKTRMDERPTRIRRHAYTVSVEVRRDKARLFCFVPYKPGIAALHK